MKNVEFHEVAVGSTFTLGGKEYTKVDKVKISCCKFFNATLVSDPKVRVGVKPHDIVEVAE